MATPRVSIGLPVFNGAKHLAASIDSVLAQSFTDFELIICDNASTDGTSEIGEQAAQRDPRVRYSRSPVNLGLAKNFNKSFELATGRYFKWQAHDDVIRPNFLELCVAALDADPAAVMAYTRRRFITYGEVVDAEGQWLRRLLPDRIAIEPHVSYEQLLLLPGYCHPIWIAGLARREFLGKTRLMGAFPCSDIVLNPELRLQGRFVEVPEELYVQRHHAAEPLWVERKTPRGEAIYLDPDNKDKMVLPGIRVWWEHLGAVWHSGLGARARMKAYSAVISALRAKLVTRVRQGQLLRRLRVEAAAVGENFTLSSKDKPVA